MSTLTVARRKISKTWLIAGSLLAFLASIATVYALILEINTSPSHNSGFFGRWESSYSYPITGGTFTFKGMTEYFQSGKYNVAGTIIDSGTVETKTYQFEYNANGAGSWTADSETLSFTLDNIKTFPKSYILDGQEIPVLLVTKLLGTSIPNLSDVYASGSSGEARIISIEKNEITLETKDPKGKLFTIHSYRQQ
ncbi:hypothetical protein [Pseudomonas alkylphenolica]|uniref:Uncharacterized protein n=1 Tax=Pseudomonas alkylphenolica TaxID=237609 RepID=A0A077F3P7_9PSED|nr:hypothetical protein [Pseudomonas alkylphenolica]AIL60038.1 hypothetical protein PSAKL28_08060 [Pseudomonas alkylphenolica]